MKLSEAGVCLGECPVITGMVEKGEDYIILNGTPRSWEYAMVSYHGWGDRV